MRLRNVKNCRDRIAIDSFVIQDPKQYKGCWHSVFLKEQPLYVEIGAGKGKFITESAMANPQNNYIGIEKFSSVLVRALDKRKELEIDNLYFLRMDAENIEDIFSANEVDGIYLNFSDPWPKYRHAKRRLTSSYFLEHYKKFLKPEGKIIFKTDNIELFEFSQKQAEGAGWEILHCTYDLHHSEYFQDNIMTEYEERFSSQGKPICRMIIKQGKNRDSNLA